MSYDSLNLNNSIRIKVKKENKKELGLALILNESLTAAVWKEESKTWAKSRHVRPE